MRYLNINKIKSSIVISLLLCVITIGVFNCSTDETQTVTNFTNLTWEDEFDVDGALNSDYWDYNIGGDGWGNNELQYYTDRLENVKVEDGMLHITALQESFEGSEYTSARIITKGKFEQTYGRYEARIKLPWGQGIWPAFWLLLELISILTHGQTVAKLISWKIAVRNQL